MLKELVLDNPNYYNIIMIATVSSGKSTLINSLLGNDRLPAKNEACTSKPFVIINENPDDYDVSVHKKNGQVLKFKDGTDNIEEVLDRYNDDDNTDMIFIKSKAEKLINGKKTAVLIDTPGVNNSQNMYHSVMTYDLLQKLNEGLIVYIINSTQIGIEDDRKLLTKVWDRVNHNISKIDIVFAVNKLDGYDLEKESINYIMNEIKDYVKSCNPIFDSVMTDYELALRLFPITALNAKIIRKHLNGFHLTRTENRVLKSIDLFEMEEYFFERYSALTEVRAEKIRKMQAEISDDDENKSCKLALLHTGVPFFEQILNIYIKKELNIQEG